LKTLDAHRWTPLAAAIAFASGACCAAPFTTITVTDGGDAGGATTCTLRQAINAANSHSTSGTCVAGSDNEIVFAASLANAVITLQQGQLSVTQPLTIVGGGQVIDAYSASRVLEISNATFSASHLSLADGNAAGNNGGAIYISGSTDTRLDHCVIYGGSAHSGGGIGISNASVTILDSQIKSNFVTNSGGGIDVRAGSTLYVAHSTISDNTADSNGGVAIYGSAVTNVPATFVSSTISGNSGTTHHGGVYSSFATLALTNTTVYGNTSAGFGGGVFADRSATTLVNSTVSQNSSDVGSGGVGGKVSGSITLLNSIVAGNVGGNCYNGNNFVSVSADHSLVYAGGTCQIADGSNGNIISAQPALGPLANNGGPTRTMALDAASPALGAGSVEFATFDATPLRYDQRGTGFPRTLDGKVDMGAWQGQGQRVFASGFEAGP